MPMTPRGALGRRATLAAVRLLLEELVWTAALEAVVRLLPDELFCAVAQEAAGSVTLG